MEPQTYFTKYFTDVIEAGIPGEGPDLRLEPIFNEVVEALARDDKPAPTSRAADRAARFVFAANSAYRLPRQQSAPQQAPLDTSPGGLPPQASPQDTRPTLDRPAADQTSPPRWIIRTALGSVLAELLALLAVFNAINSISVWMLIAAVAAPATLLLRRKSPRRATPMVILLFVEAAITGTLALLGTLTTTAGWVATAIFWILTAAFAASATVLLRKSPRATPVVGPLFVEAAITGALAVPITPIAHLDTVNAAAWVVVAFFWIFTAAFAASATVLLRRSRRERN